MPSLTAASICESALLHASRYDLMHYRTKATGRVCMLLHVCLMVSGTVSKRYPDTVLSWVVHRANPDLVKRFELDAPLNKCALCLFWLFTIQDRPRKSCTNALCMHLQGALCLVIPVFTYLRGNRIYLRRPREVNQQDCCWCRYDRATFYTQDQEKGYTDYPFLDDSKASAGPAA